MKASVVAALVRKEFRQIRRDRLMVVQMIGVPLIQLVVLANAASFEVRNSPTTIVDSSPGSLSRGAAAALAASEHFAVSHARSMEEAERRMLSGDAAVVLRFPSDFDSDLVRRGEAAVQILVSAEDGAAAGLVANYARDVLAKYAEGVSRAYGSGAVAPTAGRPSTSVRYRYNADLDYHAYMVPGILVILVTIIGTMLTAMNIVREKELGTLEQLNATPLRRSEFVAGKLIPFWIIALLELAFGLGLARVLFDLPVRGSLLLLFGSAAIYLVAALGVGLWISTVASTQQQAMFVTFFFLLLNLFMSGLFTPIASMPAWARAAAELVPLKHFIHVMRTVLLRGAGVEAVLPELAILFLMGAVVLFMALRRYSKTAG